VGLEAGSGIIEQTYAVICSVRKRFRLWTHRGIMASQRGYATETGEPFLGRPLGWQWPTSGQQLRMSTTRKNSPSKRRKQRGGSRRTVESQLRDIPTVSSESIVEDAAAAHASSSPRVQVSFLITQAQKAQLRAKGYSDDQIAQMKPAEAHQILGIE
jgi:hypothetical protein